MKRQETAPDIPVLLKDDRPHYSVILSDTICEALARGEVHSELQKTMQELRALWLPREERKAG